MFSRKANVKTRSYLHVQQQLILVQAVTSCIYNNCVCKNKICIYAISNKLCTGTVFK